LQIAFRHHVVMNPSSPEKIVQLGARIRLDSRTTVLDLCSGTGGPAVLLAQHYGCRVTCVELHEPFLEHARRRAEEAGVSHLLTLIHADAAEYMNDPGRFGAAICLGAAGVLGSFEDAATALRATVPTGGHVVIGDLYRLDGVTLEVGNDAPTWLIDAVQSSTTLSERLDELVRSRLAPITVIPSSEEDWSTYSSLIWLSVEDWMEEHPAHPEGQSMATSVAHASRTPPR
jgi:cyclopropane fatty-acyl-phospholipid synthase-like methyltransferase